MNTLTTQEITAKKTWENFVLFHPQANFLHSWNWGEFHHRLGQSIFRLGFYQGRLLKGLALLIHQPARRGPYLECPGGPLLDWQDKSLVSAFFTAAQNTGHSLGVSFLRFRPQLLESPSSRQIFRSFGCRPAPIHLHAETTWQLDLGPAEAEILAGMRKTTRYLIRRADKLGVTVVPSHDPTDIKLLYRLQLQTVKRHRFVPFSLDFLRHQFAVFAADQQALLFKAFYRRQVIAMALIIFYGPEAVYHYSGSSPQALRIPAAYALQWVAIKEAKKRGLNRYNFWGIAPTHDPRHRFAGVTLFKTGFGGYRVDYLHAHDLPLKNTYWLTWLFETLRAKSRRL